MHYFQMEIPKRGSVCNGQGERLIPGMEYFSVLLNDTEKKGLLRHDFCMQCWKNYPEYQQAAEGHVSWRSKVLYTKEMPDSSDRDQRIQTLFYSPSEEEDPAERFILAAYLQRKKRLFLRGELTDESGRILLLYEIPETEEMLPIEKVPLSGIPIQRIQLKIAEKLRGIPCG